MSGRRGSPVVLGGHAGGEKGGLSGFAFSPPGSPSKLQLARWGRFSANTEISQCLLLFFPSVCGKIPPTPGAEKVSVLFSQLRLGNSLPWDPRLRRDGGGPSHVPGGKGALQANHGEGIRSPLPGPKERDGSQRWVHTGGDKACVCDSAGVSV